MLGDDPQITAAYGRAAMAYDVARAEVYAHYPHGLPPREQLSARQRRLLDDVEHEEATLERLRQDRAAARRGGRLRALLEQPSTTPEALERVGASVAPDAAPSSGAAACSDDGDGTRDRESVGSPGADAAIGS